MQLTKIFMFIVSVILLFSCRSRQELGRPSSASGATPILSGRAAVFTVYDQASQSTRPAMGVLVSTRAALIPGLQAGETVTLVDDQRRGEKYFALNGDDKSTIFVGLEAPSNKVYALLPSAAMVPPPSSQAFGPIERQSRIRDGMRVLMFNEFGAILGKASVLADGQIKLIFEDQARRYYPKDSTMSYIFQFFFGPMIVPPEPLRSVDEVKMVKKGGAIIAVDTKYDGIVQADNGWAFYMKDPKSTATVDIIGFFAEDKNSPYNPNREFTIVRKDILPEVIDEAFDTIGMKVPAEIKGEIMQYMNCKP